MDCIVPGAKVFGNSNSTPITVTQYTRHPDYYFEDGTLVLQVENVLFNVTRSTFTRHSRVFRDVFSLPQTRSALDEVEGSSDRHPVYLPGISKVDFERLLWILYPPRYGVLKPQTADEWCSILHLATRWEFEDIRALAIREIQRHPMTPVEIVCLSREFDIHSPWTLKAYMQLCERPEPLSLAEAAALGLHTAVLVAQVRERLRRPLGRRYSSVTPATANPARRQGSATPRGKTPGVESGRATNSGMAVGGPRARGLLESARLVAETFGLVYKAGDV